MGTPEPDQYQNGSLINGVPVATFAPRPYGRIITGMLVKNDAPSSVADILVASLSAFPAASTPLGSNNQMLGRIKVPAGQPFFVRWSAVGTSAATATARVNLEKDDDPLGANLGGVYWSDTLVTNFVIPSNAGPNDPRLEIGNNIPSEVRAYFLGVQTVVAGIFLYFNAHTYIFMLMTLDGGTAPTFVFGSCGSGTVRTTFTVDQLAGLGFYPFYNTDPVGGQLQHTGAPMTYLDIASAALSRTMEGVKDVYQVGNSGNSSIELATGTTFTLDSGSQLIVNSAHPGIDVRSGGSIAIESGGIFAAVAGGQTNFGNAALVQSGGSFEFQNSSSLQIDWFSDVKIDPNGNRGATSARRGLIVNKIFTGSVVTPTGGAANFVSFPTATFRNGRAFRFVCAGTWSASAVGVQALYWLNNGVGTNIAGEGRTVELVTAANQSNIGDVEMMFVNTSGADVSTGMQFQVIAPAGATVGINGAGRLPVWAYIEDYGAAADWSGLGSL